MDRDQLRKLLDNLPDGAIHGQAEEVRRKGLGRSALQPVMNVMTGALQKTFRFANGVVGLDAGKVLENPSNPHSFIVGFADDTGIIVTLRAATKDEILKEVM